MSARNNALTGERAAHTVARALADPQRYRIMKMLAQAQEGTQCSVLFAAIKLAPATLSHHMRELRDAGLVEERRTGRTVQYQLRHGALENFLHVLRHDLLRGSNANEDVGEETICDLPQPDPSIR